MASFETPGRGLAILAGIGLLLAGPAWPVRVTAAAPPVDEAATIDAHVRSTLESWAVPGAAIAIVRDGAVVHLAAFGQAADGPAMTTDTPLVIGSVGKSITALAVRQLVETGLLDLDAPVTRYVPWFTLARPEAAPERITIGDLLRHESGLSTADGQDPRWYVPGLTPEAVARGMADLEPDRHVGTYEYSNLNYVLLGVVIEAVSGQRYGDYVAASIFAPLAMDRSFTDLATAQAVSGAVSGHRYLFGVPVVFAESYPSGMVPAGYQISSAEDMAHFVAALANGGVFAGTNVIDPARPGNPGVAFGTDWQPFGAVDAGLSSSQSGASLVTNADILVVPAERLGIVVLLNANPIQLTIPGGAAELAHDIKSIVLGGGTTSALGVRQVYVVADAILIVLAALLLIHAIRARTWAARLVVARHPRILLGRTILADAILPLAVLVCLPLAIGSTGSSPSGDIIAGWRFILWTLPDLGFALLTLAAVPLVLGCLKLTRARTGSRSLSRRTPVGAAG